MLRLMLYVIGLLVLVTKINGESKCPDTVLRSVQDVDWVRCNEEKDRRMEQLKKQTSNTDDRDEVVDKVCCVLSDTITCWVDALRSKCGNDAANEMIKSASFQGDCASWKYADSISHCQLWYTKWWFITIVAILVVGIVAALVVFGLRKRARR